MVVKYLPHGNTSGTYDIATSSVKTLQNRVEAFLLSHPTIQYGDIIFVGSTSDRQEYGFQLVLDNGKTLTGEDGSSLPLQRSIRDELKRHGIHCDYEEIMKMYFFGDYDTAFEECIDLYQENDLLKIPTLTLQNLTPRLRVAPSSVKISLSFGLFLFGITYGL
jgi:hypothetical protein